MRHGHFLNSTGDMRLSYKRHVGGVGKKKKKGGGGRGGRLLKSGQGEIQILTFISIRALYVMVI